MKRLQPDSNRNSSENNRPLKKAKNENNCSEIEKPVPKKQLNRRLFFTDQWKSLAMPPDEFSCAAGMIIKDLKCLSPNCQLSDEVMNLYVVMLQRDIQKRYKTKTMLMNTFFFTKLTTAPQKGDGKFWESGQANKKKVEKVYEWECKKFPRDYNFKAVKRWTRSRKIFAATGFDTLKSIFELDLLIIPIHVANAAHWMLGVVDFKAKEIMCLDPLTEAGYEKETEFVFKTMEQWLKDEWKDKVGHGECSKFERRLVDIPQQENDTECGVFALAYAYYVTKGTKFSSFPSSDQLMDNARDRILDDILKLSPIAASLQSLPPPPASMSNLPPPPQSMSNLPPPPQSMSNQPHMPNSPHSSKVSSLRSKPKSVSNSPKVSSLRPKPKSINNAPHSAQAVPPKNLPPPPASMTNVLRMPEFPPIMDPLMNRLTAFTEPPIN